MAAKKKSLKLDFEKPLEDLERQLDLLSQSSESSHVDVAQEISAIEDKIEQVKKDIYAGLSPWQKIQISRHPERPHSLCYINSIFEEFQELHGDRCFMDDGATVGGLAIFQGQPVMVLGQQKGRTTKEKLKRNFGSPNPEGYRKALRLMKMAERFNLPIISLIDTAGAYPGIGGEERHVAEAIAVNIREMSQLTVPIIAVIIGEGGSGGALGVGLADRVLILENAYYSVISPEGCAAILWKDRAYAPDAAEALKLTADKLMELEVVDGVVPEPMGGAHQDAALAAANVAGAIAASLKELSDLSDDDLLEGRYARYRKLGVYAEA